MIFNITKSIIIAILINEDGCASSKLCSVATGVIIFYYDRFAIIVITIIVSRKCPKARTSVLKFFLRYETTSLNHFLLPS